MSVAIKRLQQAVFEMAASQNRSAGSGGGSGLSGVFAGCGIATGQTISNTGSFVLVAGTPVSFSFQRAATFFADFSINIFWNSGTTAGQFGLFLDGTAVSNSYAPLIATQAASDTLVGSASWAQVVEPGGHTLDMRFSPGGASSYTVNGGVLTVLVF